MDMFDVMLGSKLGGGGGGEAANYNDLSGLPQINGVELKGNKSTAQLLISFTASDVGALPDSTKYAAAVALSIDQSTYVVTAQLKDQDGNNIGAASTVDLPLETMVVGGSYDAQNQKIVLTLKNGSTTDIAIGALISGLQPELVVGTNLDDTPTSASTNPVTSGGVWAPMAAMIDGGAKNRAEIMLGTATYNNLTFTVDKEAGTITVSTDGNPAAQYKGFRFLGDPDNTGWAYGVPIPRGTYVVRGINPTMEQTGMRYIIGITPSSGSTRTTTQIWTDSEFTVTTDTTRIDMALYIPTGWTSDTPQVCKPMICLKKLWDVAPTLTPYAPTNAELYQMILALQSGTRSVQMRTEPDEASGEEER